MMKVLRSPEKVKHAWPVNMTEADREEFDGADTYETNEVSISTYKNVKLDASSIAYLGYKLIRETVPFASERNYYQFSHLFKTILFSQKRRLAEGKNYLLLTDNWSAGHFHFISDVLPKCICLKEDIGSFALLLPDRPYFRNTGLPLIKKVVQSDLEVIWLEPGVFYHVPEISLVNKVASSGKYDPQIMKVLNEVLYKGVYEPNQRVYLSRKKAGFRKVLNEEEILEVMNEFGFKSYCAEDFPIEDQMRLFSSCSVLVGIHGAGLSNCIFMKPGGILLELRKKEGDASNVGYWHLADSIGHKYFYLNGESDSDTTIVGRGSNIKVDLKKLKEELKRIL